MRQKLFTKEIDNKLFAQYKYGSDLSKQMVVAKIFNPYNNGVWFIINSDPNDPDYLWAIVDLFEIEAGSVSREDLQTIKVPPFGLNLERDLYFQPINAQELYDRLRQGERFEHGGSVDVIQNDKDESYLTSVNAKPTDAAIKLAGGGETAKSWTVMYFKEGKNRFGEKIESAFNNTRVQGTLKEAIEKVKEELVGNISYATIKDRSIGDVLVAKVKQDGTINIYREGYGINKMAKGGRVKVANTYIPNKDVKELMVVLKNQSINLKGSDILDGVYAKNISLKTSNTTKRSSNTAKGVYDAIIEKSKDYSGVDNKDLEILKISDVQKLLDAGYNEKEILGIYLGASAFIDVKADNEFASTYFPDGLFSMTEESIGKSIDSYVSAAQNKQYELGFKYPDFNWKAVIKKYNIKNNPINIEFKNAMGDVDTYEIFVGDKVVFGHKIKRARYKNGKFDYEDVDTEYIVNDYNKLNAKQKENGYKAGFNGGYWGVVSSEKQIIEDIAKMVLAQPSGYAKDVEIFTNRLGGVGYEELDKNDIKYAKGGVTFKDKVKSISNSLKGKKVPSKLKKDYGATYDKKESVLAATRIAGAMKAKMESKKKK